MDNIKEYVVNYKPNRIPVVSGLEQWDYGQYLVIKDIPLELLEDEKEMHFCFPDSLKSVVVKAEYEDDVLKAKIPKFIFQKQIESCLYSSYKAYAFVYLKTNEYGKTIYRIALEIEARPKPDDYEYEEEQLYFEELTEILDAKADKIKYSGSVLYLLSGGHILSRVPIKVGSGDGVGIDGREVELINNGTYIQWRYFGDEEWNNLVALSDLNGKDGMTPYIDNGNWYIGEQNTGVKAQGVDGRGIKTLEKIETKENIDTYKITFTDDTEFIFEVVNAPIGAIVEETDPTVPEWAKQSEKPTYTAKEVGALPSDTKIPSKTSDLENDSNYVTETDLNVVETGLTNLETDLTNLATDYNNNKEFIIQVTQYTGGVHKADKTYEEIEAADKDGKRLIVMFHYNRFECVDTKSGGGIYIFDNVAIESTNKAITRERIVIKEKDIIEYYKDVINLSGANISKEDIENAVNEYLDANPVQSGATEEQVKQIQQNTDAIAEIEEGLPLLLDEFATNIEEYVKENAKNYDYLFKQKMTNTIKYDLEEILFIGKYAPNITNKYYKVLDYTPRATDLSGGVIIKYNSISGNNLTTYVINKERILENNNIVMGMASIEGYNELIPLFVIIPKGGAEVEEVFYKEGFYVFLLLNNNLLLSEICTTTYDVSLNIISDKYLPDTMATKEYVDSVSGGSKEIFEVIVTKDGDEYVADKTNSEIYEAYTSGKLCVLKYSISHYFLRGIGKNTATFVSQPTVYETMAMQQEFTITDNGITNEYRVLKASGSDTSDAVQYVEQELTEKQQMQARKNQGLYYTEKTPITQKVFKYAYVGWWELMEDSLSYTNSVYNTEYSIDFLGNTYNVIGKCKGRSAAGMGGEIVEELSWIGNHTLINGEYDWIDWTQETDYTDLPFVVYWDEIDMNCSPIVVIDSTVTPSMGKGLTISQVTGTETVYVPIPEEYIPNTIARKSDIPTDIGGATAEQLAQIEQNKKDIGKLSDTVNNKLDADKLPEAVNTALAQAKASGEFKGDKGDKGDTGDTPQKGTDYFTNADKQELVTDVLNALPTWTGGSY